MNEPVSNEMGQPPERICPEMALARVADLVTHLYRASEKHALGSESFRAELDVVRYTEARTKARVLADVGDLLKSILDHTDFLRVIRGEVQETRPPTTSPEEVPHEAA